MDTFVNSHAKFNDKVDPCLHRFLLADKDPEALGSKELGSNLPQSSYYTLRRRRTELLPFHI